jgi:hypothetical protein
VLALLCALGAAGAAAAQADADGWKTVTLRPVHIRVRAVPDSPLHQVWAEGEMAAPVAHIQAAVMDPDAFVRFMPHVKESRALGPPDEAGVQYAYTRLEFGPLVSSRDYVLRVQLLQGVDAEGKGTFHNRWSAAPERLPVRRGVVRLTVNEGSWRVMPLAGGRAKVEYRFTVDPGGSIPAFAARMGNEKSVTATFTRVEQEAQRRWKAAGGDE